MPIQFHTVWRFVPTEVLVFGDHSFDDTICPDLAESFWEGV